MSDNENCIYLYKESSKANPSENECPLLDDYHRDFEAIIGMLSWRISKLEEKIRETHGKCDSGCEGGMSAPADAAPHY